MLRSSQGSPRREELESDELMRSPLLQCAFALQLGSPVVAVLGLDPAALAWQVTTRAALGNDALELVLANGLPQRRAVVERLGASAKSDRSRPGPRGSRDVSRIEGA
jgi:hypothetical protein